jgi:tetratricopeptide (TPR) repeat protein
MRKMWFIFFLALLLIPNATRAQTGGVGQVEQFQQLQEQQAVDTRFADYFQRLQQNPKDVQAHLALGQACLDKGLFEMAIVSFGRALEFDPTLAAAHYGLSKTYRKKKIKTSEVIELEKAVAVAPSNHQYIYELGVVYMEPESYNYDKAKKQFKELKKQQSPLAARLGQLMELE